MKTFFVILAVVCIAFLSSAAVFSGEVHEAAKNGELEKLRTLLDGNPKLLYAKDELGKTPLHWATGRGQPEAVKLLLDTYKTDVNVRNNNQGTPLHVAASQAQPECAKILIAHGADVNARTKNSSTPLHFAAYKGKKSGHIETAEILLENGADVNAQTDSGATPLAFALYRGNTEIITLLKKYGARGGTRQGNRSMMKPDQKMGVDE
ncbi:MAG: ankyrin repeat domain-containing protein [Candidatus Omnitrophica bacterium]|nr:ankyrin repeat domain-containing protein [Candidatus Omnitrophota bacterium]